MKNVVHWDVDLSGVIMNEPLWYLSLARLPRCVGMIENTSWYLTMLSHSQSLLCMICCDLISFTRSQDSLALPQY